LGAREMTARVGERSVIVRQDLSQRQIDIMLAGGIINWLRARLGGRPDAPAREATALLNPG